jgi:drug/metabolite transporter (DMT)-like permease
MFVGLLSCDKLPGARRVLLIGTLAPPMTAVAAMIVLQERLNVSAWCGILLTILGVASVIIVITGIGLLFYLK